MRFSERSSEPSMPESVSRLSFTPSPLTQARLSQSSSPKERQAADAALADGHGALEELGFRRKGLGVSLLVILALLVALGLKIRSISP